jgi:DNA-3-methyladenine glycosylase II
VTKAASRAPRADHARGFDLVAARRQLARGDRELGRWMRRIGEIETAWHRRFDPVDSLARSILYQQLSGKAASTIHGRVLERFGERGRLTPSGLSRAPEQGLRDCGVSFNKIAALKDLSAKAAEGVVPTLAAMRRLHHDEIVERLTEVRGIGRWTVEMMLIFWLGRPDILPIDDLGIRKGAQIVLGHDEMPKPKQLLEIGERWAPFRTAASLYLWRIADFDKDRAGAAKVKRSQD